MSCNPHLGDKQGINLWDKLNISTMQIYVYYILPLELGYLERGKNEISTSSHMWFT